MLLPPVALNPLNPLSPLDPLNPHSLLASLGALGAFLVLFAETGLLRADQALRRYGTGKAIVLARFIPLVRTVLNPLAGTVGVPIRTFTLWQVTGGLAWSLGVTLAGYALGSHIPGLDRYLLPIVPAVAAVSLLPILVEALRARRRKPATSTTSATREGP